MQRKSVVKLEEIPDKPKALIICAHDFGSFLKKKLDHLDCDTVLVPDAQKIHGRYYYIFLFDETANAADLLRRNLEKDGKIIIINTQNEREITASTEADFRILTTGDPGNWKEEELAGKILHFMFKDAETKLTDIRMNSVNSANAYIKNELVNTDKKNSASNYRENPPPKKALTYIDTRHKIPQNFPQVTRAYNMKILLFILIVIIMIPAGLSYAGISFALSARKTIENLQSDAASSDWEKMSYDIKEAKKHLETVKNIYNISYKILIPLRSNKHIIQIGKLIESSENLLNSGEKVLHIISNPSFSPENKSILVTSENLVNIENDLAGLENSLIKASDYLEESTIPYFPKDKSRSTLIKYLEKITGSKKVIPAVKRIFTSDSPKIFLVLFQNNMELRATGGFIGSFGILMLDKNKIADFRIMDVYTADGQLKGHVEPPYPIRKYLSQPNWFLRDSNFDPDFAVSAKQALWFIDKELAIKPDGVIGINLFLLQDILRILGPVSLADFNNVKISADDLFPKVHSFIMDGFFAGSSGKKDILTGISNALIGKISGKNGVPFLDILAVLNKNLEEKNILIYTNNISDQKEFESLSVAGRISANTCHVTGPGNTTRSETTDNNCYPDYLAVSESNFGVNKANYFVTKSLIVEKLIAKETGVTTNLSLYFENSAVKGIDKESEYSSYVRFLVPRGSMLINASLNNSFLEGNQIDITEYGNDKLSYGIFMRLAPSNKAILKISYLNPIIPSNPFTYQLLFQKQPGDKKSPLVLSVKYSDIYHLTPVNFPLSSNKAREISYITDTSVDRIFVFESR